MAANLRSAFRSIELSEKALEHSLNITIVTYNDYSKVITVNGLDGKVLEDLKLENELLKERIKRLENN